MLFLPNLSDSKQIEYFLRGNFAVLKFLPRFIDGCYVFRFPQTTFALVINNQKSEFLTHPPKEGIVLDITFKNTDYFWYLLRNKWSILTVGRKEKLVVQYRNKFEALFKLLVLYGCFKLSFLRFGRPFKKLDEKAKNKTVKKAFILFGSPRNEDGFTWSYLDGFIKGLRLGGADVETIFLYKQNFLSCKGCYQCFHKGDGTCFLNDNFIDIFEKIKQADLLVFASPIYFGGMSSGLKKALERCFPFSGSAMAPAPLYGGRFIQTAFKAKIIGFATAAFPSQKTFKPFWHEILSVAEMANTEFLGVIGISSPHMILPLKKDADLLLEKIGLEVAQKGRVNQVLYKKLTRLRFDSSDDRALYFSSMLMDRFKKEKIG